MAVILESSMTMRVSCSALPLPSSRELAAITVRLGEAEGGVWAGMEKTATIPSMDGMTFDDKMLFLLASRQTKSPLVIDQPLAFIMNRPGVLDHFDGLAVFALEM